MPTPSSGRFRLQPRLWHVFPALAILIALAAGGGLVAAPLRAEGNDLGAALISPLIAIVFIALVAAVGWLPAVMRERDRHPSLWPAFVVGGALTAYLIGVLVTTEWPAVVASVFLAGAIGGLGAGLAEEVMFRGVVVVTTRTRLREVWVWMCATLTFASVHLLNVLAGQELAPTLLQVLFAALAGTSFYVLRRATGTLIIPILFHALNNAFAVLPNSMGALWQLAANGIALIALIPVIRSADRVRRLESQPIA